MRDKQYRVESRLYLNLRVEHLQWRRRRHDGQRLDRIRRLDTMTMATTMAADDDDNEVDGDSATGNDDGDGAMGDDNDNDNDGTTMMMAMARWATVRRDTMPTTMATGDDNYDRRRPTKTTTMRMATARRATKLTMMATMTTRTMATARRIPSNCDGQRGQ